MSKLVLTADQIFALAYILKAKYLDYYYISLANRDGSNKLWLSEITKQLVSQGILTEDFSGDTTIEPEVETIVKPLFFGVKESSLDIDIFGENEENKGYRFHFLDGKITMTETVNGGFEITDVNCNAIREIINSILPNGYSVESAETNITFDVGNISRVFVVKNTELNNKSYIATFIESNDVIYEENINNIVYSVSEKDFKDKIYKIITEA